MTVYSQDCTQITNGISSDLHGIPTSNGFGIYRPQISVYEIVPEAEGDIVFMAAQNVVENVPMTLNNAIVVTKGGYTVAEAPYLVGINFITDNQVQFGVDGSLLITGIDNYLNIVQEELTFLSTDVFVASQKTYLGIISAVPSVTLPNQCIIDNSNIIGIPHFINRRDATILSVMYGNISEYLNVPIIPGNIWRTTAPSLTSIDAHGTFDLSTIFTINNLLTIVYIVDGARADLQHQLTDPNSSSVQIQQAQTLIYANAGANPIVNVPVLTPYDEIGLQYPGNMTAFNAFPTT